MILTCPKCSFQYKKIDNFCIECGKDLSNKLKKINFKNKLIKK